MSGSSAWRPDRGGVWHEVDDSASVLRRGFVTVKSLISTDLAADLLDGVSMTKAQIISNALQQAVTGELRRRCEEELRSSSALADLVEQVFGVRTFRVSTPKRLSSPCEAEPQMPHADDFCNRELIGIVHLRNGQQPTEVLTYDAAARYPTGIFVPCSSCQALDQVSDAELRRREVDATTFQCDECACELDGATGPQNLEGCERDPLCFTVPLCASGPRARGTSRTF